jgi:hypothetical protein
MGDDTAKDLAVLCQAAGKVDDGRRRFIDAPCSPSSIFDTHFCHALIYFARENL